MSDLIDAAKRAAKERRLRDVQAHALERARKIVGIKLRECEFLMAPGNPEFFAQRPDGDALRLEFRWAGVAQLTPLEERWPEANAAYCRLWVERWDDLIPCLRQSGDILRLGGLTPLDPDMRAMHDLLLRRITGESAEAVTEALASLRAGMEPDAEEVKGQERIQIGGRGELGRYFAWLRAELERTRTAAIVLPAPESGSTDREPDGAEHSAALPPAEKAAWDGYLQAREALETDETVCSPESSRPTEEHWEWLRENRSDLLLGRTKPPDGYETWETYVRKARKKINGPARGRPSPEATGRSWVRRQDH